MKKSSSQRLALVEQVIDSYGTSLLAYLRTLTKSPEDADDLFNELWLFVIRRFKDEHIGEYGLLRRKCYQLFVDHYRRKVRNPVNGVEEVPEAIAPGNSHEPLSDEQEEAFKMRFFNDYPVVLPQSHKDALWYHCRMGYTFKEISSIMEVPSSTVGDWVTAARQAIANFVNTTP